MHEFDLVVRNAKAITASDTFTGDIGVRDGRIVQLGLGIGPGVREIDAAGRAVTPAAWTRTATSTSRCRRPSAWPTTSTPARARRPAAVRPR